MKIYLLALAVGLVAASTSATAAPIKITAERHGDFSGLNKAAEKSVPNGGMHAGEKVVVTCVVLETGRLSQCVADSAWASLYATESMKMIRVLPAAKAKYPTGTQVVFTFRVPE